MVAADGEFLNRLERQLAPEYLSNAGVGADARTRRT
jgi:hypothetical protein